MATLKSVDHVERGIRKLLFQYRQVPQIVAWLSTYLEWIQKTEDGIWQIIEARTLDGVGIQLDIIGRLVGLGRGAFDRNASNDDDYRAGLIIQIRALRSRGTLPDFEELLTQLTDLMGGGYTVENRHPARVRVVLTGVAYDPNLVAGVLIFAKAAGVALTFLWSPSSSTSLFRFSGSNAVTPASPNGWGAGVFVRPLIE